MNIYDAVKKSIEYIEANLNNDISVFDVANAVCYSQFYFSRQFSIHTHTSIYDYILKRKLSESYKYLLSEKPRIIDLAFRYGFSSHEVFTRAFRKMFGENPSEASVYKPLLIYEPIDISYLDFLNGLKIEVIESEVCGCFFEPDSAGFGEGSAIVLLSDEHLLDIKCILEGRVSTGGGGKLSFRLQGLKSRIRIHHSDAKHSLRYFLDNFYHAAAMKSNFILLNNSNGCIDIIAPERDGWTE